MQRATLLLVAAFAGCRNNGSKPESISGPREHPESAPRMRGEAELNAANETPSSRPKSSLPSGAVFVGCGYLFVDNEGRPPFSALLSGVSVTQVPTGGELVFVSDGTLVEVTTTTAEEIGVSNARGAALLRSHEDWELDHLKRTKEWPGLKAKEGGPLDVGTAEVQSLMWGVDLPAEVEVRGQMVNRLAFVTAAIDDSVLVLGMPLRASDDTRLTAAKAGSMLRSIKRLPGPLDLDAFAAELKASKPPWKGCPRNE